MPAKTQLDESSVPRIGIKGQSDPPVLDSGEIPLEFLRRFLRTNARWLGLAVIAGGILGVAAASIGPAVYDGVATLLVAQPIAATDGSRPSNVSTFGALLETNWLASSAISKFHLDQPPYRLAANNFLKDTLILDEVHNTNLIRVHARVYDSKLAADLADYVATTAVALSDDINRQQTADLRGQLRGMLDDATTRLKTAEQQLLDFRRTAQVDLSRKDADAALDQRGQLLALTVDIQSEKARLARAEQDIKGQPRLLSAPRAVNAEAALRGLDPREVPDSAASPRRTLPEDSKADSRVVTEQQKPTDKSNADNKAGLDLSNPFVNPVYQVLDYQISLSRTRLAALEARRQELVGVYSLGGKELTSLGNLYPKEIELRRLETEHDLARTVYSEVALQYERARLQAASGSARLQMIDHAVPPTISLPRHRSLWALVGALGGFTAVIVIVAVAAFLRA